MDKKESIIVGWCEWVKLPELGVPAIKAKIDTGAATSSIHAYDIVLFENKGKQYVNFELHPLQKNKKIVIFCTSEVIEKSEVKSSNGETEVRPVISTELRIGGKKFRIKVNLTNRDSMGFRMLIGREAMDRLLVNPNSKFVQGKKKPKTILKLYENKEEECK